MRARIALEYPPICEFEHIEAFTLGIRIEIPHLLQEGFRILELIECDGQEGLVVPALCEVIRDLPQLEEPLVRAGDSAVTVHHQQTICNGIDGGLEQRIRAVAFRNIRFRSSHADRFSLLIPERYASVEDPHVGPVLPLDTVLLVKFRSLFGEIGVECLQDAVEIIRVNSAPPFVEMVAQFVRGIASHRFPSCRKEHLAGLDMPIPDAVVASSDRQLPTFFAGRERFFHAFPMGDVETGPGHCQWMAGRVSCHDALVEDGPHVSIGPYDATFHIERRVGDERGINGGEDPVMVVRQEGCQEGLVGHGCRSRLMTEDPGQFVGPLHPAAVDVPVPTPEMGKGLRMGQTVRALFQGDLGVFPLEFRRDTRGECREERVQPLLSRDRFGVHDHDQAHDLPLFVPDRYT